MTTAAVTVTAGRRQEQARSRPPTHPHGSVNHPRVGEDGPMTKIEPLEAVHERALPTRGETDITSRPGLGDRLVEREPAERFDYVPAADGDRPEGAR
jgi:hypothetical protein